MLGLETVIFIAVKVYSKNKQKFVAQATMVEKWLKKHTKTTKDTCTDNTAPNKIPTATSKDGNKVQDQQNVTGIGEASTNSKAKSYLKTETAHPVSKSVRKSKPKKVSSESSSDSEKSDHKNIDAAKKIDKAGSSSESNADDSYLDVPDAQRVLGSGREDQRSKNRKPKAQMKQQRHKTTQRKTDSDAEEEVRRLNREKIVQGYLKTILEENPGGIHLDNICDALAKKKVRNFNPEILGYSTLESWALSQPTQIVNFDRRKGLIMPGRAIEIPLSSDSESSD